MDREMLKDLLNDLGKKIDPPKNFWELIKHSVGTMEAEDNE